MNNENQIKCWKDQGVFGHTECEKLSKYGHCRHCPEYSKAGRTLLEREIPEGYIDEWTEIISKPKEVESQDTVSLVVFRLSSEWFALKSNFFQEAVEVKPIHYVPFRTNRIFKGLVNVNGELLLCISGTELLGVNENGKKIDESQKIETFNRMVVVINNGNRFVFQVDEMLGIIRLPSDMIEKSPATVSNTVRAFSGGVFWLKKKNVDLLDEERFFKGIQRSFTW